MKVLVVGGGGREHALIWKLKQSPRLTEIYCAPGNGGIAGDAECIPYKPEEINGLRDFTLKEKIDLTVVGPEAPLVAGIVDLFEASGLRVFGPSARAAQLEGSKVFAKEAMRRYGIPTAAFQLFREYEPACRYVRSLAGPCVVKADGLAAGKGVIVADNQAEAEDAVRLIMKEKAFGGAGDAVIIEERLEGEEVSVLAFTDGHTVLPMVASQDHKRAGDGDSGPNTGGMGAYSPPPVYSPSLHEQVCSEVLAPLIHGLQRDGIIYRGVIYAGLMITAGGPYVLEFNCRFGDPETQVVIPRLRNDLLEVLEAVLSARLSEIELEWDPRPAACVVIASGGYPGPYEKGKVISGLGQVPPDILVFHSGTSQSGSHLVTAGGRVLNVTALGNTIEEAVRRAYQGVDGIYFEGMHFRRDIAHRALNHEWRK
ncbi:MAG: phosphoribosylamine--glycine ligase [Thermacetogeniaceae bacterium]